MGLFFEMGKPRIAVWFSCGAASAVAAYETLRLYRETHEIRIVNNPVIEEHPDNLRFLWDVQQWLDHRIEFAANNAFGACSAKGVWEKRSYMSGTKGAPCTDLLKKAARTQWEEANDWDHTFDWMVMGFTTDERKRHDRFVLTERNGVLPVLIVGGYSKQDCIDFLAAEGLRLPEMYSLGYPNANCIGCVKATSPTYWNHVRVTHPDIFADRAKQSREIGARLVRVNNERIFLDELDPNAQGRPLAAMKMPDCSIFCEEMETTDDA